MKYLACLFFLVPVASYAAMPYDAVCRVEDHQDGEFKSWGSGVLVFSEGGRGLLVTNAHVVHDNDTFKVCWGSQTREGKTVAYHPEVDLAYIVVYNPPVKPARIGTRDTHIVFAGFPHYDRFDLHWQYGNVKSEDMVTCWWRNGPVPGMSGGGVFDRKDGDLCGLISCTNFKYGLGVADVALIVTSNKLKDPDTWQPITDYVGQEDETCEMEASKPSKQVITKEYKTTEAPHWDTY